MFYFHRHQIPKPLGQGQPRPSFVSILLTSSELFLVTEHHWNPKLPSLSPCFQHHQVQIYLVISLPMISPRGRMRGNGRGCLLVALKRLCIKLRRKWKPKKMPLNIWKSWLFNFWAWYVAVRLLIQYKKFRIGYKNCFLLQSMNGW